MSDWNLSPPTVHMCKLTHSLIPRTEKEPREQLVRDNAHKIPVLDRLHDMHIYRRHTETVCFGVHRPEDAHANDETDSERDVVVPVLLVDALLVVVEEPDDGVELVVKSRELRVHSIELTVKPGVYSTELRVHVAHQGVHGREPDINVSEYVVDMTNPGEQGTRDALHVGHA